MKRLYVAGPMSGLPEFNFPAFERAAQRLRAVGYDVLSPHEVALPCGCIGLPPQCGADDHTWSEFMRSDLIAFLQHADGVALLPGWRDSKGANLEVDVADRLDMPSRAVDWWIARAEAAA